MTGLRGRAKGTLAIIRMYFTGGLQYRAAALAGIATQFFWGFMEILLYRAFYRADPGAFPMEFSALVAYIWIQQATLGLLMVWNWDKNLLDSIVSGNVAYELCRPLPLYSYWFWRDMARRLSRTVLRCAPILLIALCLPEPFRLRFKGTGGMFLLFLLSMALTALLVAAFDMLVYVGSIFTVSPLGLRIVASNLFDLFGGSLLPLPFLPDGLRQAAELSPFASMQNVPLRIFGGDIAGGEACFRIGLQCFWLIVLVLFGKWLMARAYSRLTVQGG